MFQDVIKELKREYRLKKKGEWRKRICLWPKVVYNPDVSKNVVLWPGQVYWEQYVIGHYGYEGGWYASTKKFGTYGNKETSSV